jgi:hypothetical protein
MTFQELYKELSNVPYEGQYATIMAAFESTPGATWNAASIYKMTLDVGVHVINSTYTGLFNNGIQILMALHALRCLPRVLVEEAKSLDGGKRLDSCIEFASQVNAILSQCKLDQLGWGKVIA